MAVTISSVPSSRRRNRCDPKRNGSAKDESRAAMSPAYRPPATAAITIASRNSEMADAGPDRPNGIEASAAAAGETTAKNTPRSVRPRHGRLSMSDDPCPMSANRATAVRQDPSFTRSSRRAARSFTPRSHGRDDAEHVRSQPRSSEILARRPTGCPPARWTSGLRPSRVVEPSRLTLVAAGRERPNRRRTGCRPEDCIWTERSERSEPEREAQAAGRSRSLPAERGWSSASEAALRRREGCARYGARVRTRMGRLRRR